MGGRKQEAGSRKLECSFETTAAATSLWEGVGMAAGLGMRKGCFRSPPAPPLLRAALLWAAGGEGSAATASMRLTIASSQMTRYLSPSRSPLLISAA